VSEENAAVIKVSIAGVSQTPAPKKKGPTRKPARGTFGVSPPGPPTHRRDPGQVS